MSICIPSWCTVVVAAAGVAGEDNFLVIPVEDRAPDASAKLPSPSIVDIVTCSGACDSVDES